MTLEEALRAAEEHRRAGRWAQARAAYEQVLGGWPGEERALHGLGLVAERAGEWERAAELLGRATAGRPGEAGWQNDLGRVLSRGGRLEEAAACFERVIELRPRGADGHNNLGITLRGRGRLEEAIAAYRRAIALNPEYAQAWFNLGNALRDRHDLAGAAEAYARAGQIAPELAEAHNGLGATLGLQRRLEEAVEALSRAVALRPGHAGAQANLGVALGDLGRLDEASAAFRAAIAANPEHVEAHLGLGQAALTRGDFAAGWPLYEWRLRMPKVPRTKPLPQPRWRGEALEGKTLFLHAEQGIGDTLQFIRYAGEAARRGARVIVGCEAPVARLVARARGVERVLLPGERLPHVDFQCPLPSLPLAFGTVMGSIPAEVPYVWAEEGMVRAWGARMGLDPGSDEPGAPAMPTQTRAWHPAGRGPGRGLRVGLVWAGNPEHRNDHNRSIALSRLAPLARWCGRVVFYSLQKGAAAGQTAGTPELRLADFTAELSDMAETAALVANLDLVISVDTSVAHLAGAMGRPVWLLLPRVAEWRWMEGRRESPWYPTMRLFRQGASGDWDGVVEEVGREMGEWVGGEAEEV